MLLRHSYGKARVRVMKVIRNRRRHQVKEVEITILLHGRFGTSYTHGDNRLVVPTDTMKNTANVLARRHLEGDIEKFGCILAEHFLKKYRQVSEAHIRLVEHLWERIAIKGHPHAHSFIEQNVVQPFAEVTGTRKKTVVRSGIDDLRVLKTTGSGFKGFPKDEFTTLVETDDRLLRTDIRATWTYSRQPDSYSKANDAIVDAVLRVFAAEFSPSVQTTLYQMGEAALSAVEEISEISITLPNKHCIRVEFNPFGDNDRGDIFVPTEEPHGLIEGTVAR